MTDKPRVDYIRVKWILDEQPDMSYLETKLSEDGKTILSSMRYSQEELNEHPIRTKRYIKEDMQRLEQFNSGELCVYGCIAEAEVSYPVNANGDRRIQKFTSGGLWGIESDSDREYREETAKEQLEDLKEHLERFNIETPRHRWMNGDYWEDIKKEVIDKMDIEGITLSRDSMLSEWVKVED